MGGNSSDTHLHDEINKYNSSLLQFTTNQIILDASQHPHIASQLPWHIKTLIHTEMTNQLHQQAMETKALDSMMGLHQGCYKCASN